MKDLCTLLGIERNPSTAYHPITDGQTKRINQEIEQYLRIFINERQNDWADWLSMAQFTYNDKVHSSTGHSLFFLNYGRHPYKGTEPRMKVTNKSAMDFKAELEEMRREAMAALKKAAEDMKRYYDKGKQPAKQYKAGDRVYVEGKNITTTQPAKKLDDKRYGPFKVLEKVGSSAYKLDLPKTWKAIHPIFNETLLTPFREPVFQNQKKPNPPPAVEVEGSSEYEVESIDDSRVFRKGLQYLVNWKGYPKEERTWEKATELKKVQKKIDDFHKRNPSAPRPTPKELQFMYHDKLTQPIFKQKLFNWTTGRMDPHDNYGTRLTGKAIPMPRKIVECRKGWCNKCKDVHGDVDL